MRVLLATFIFAFLGFKAFAECRFVRIKYGIDGNFLAIRERPDWKSRKVGSIYSGDVIKVCDIVGDESNTWKKISSTDGTPTFVNAHSKFVQNIETSNQSNFQLFSRDHLYSRPGYNYQSYTAESEKLAQARIDLESTAQNYLEDLKSIDKQYNQRINQEKEKLEKLKTNLEQIKATGIDDYINNIQEQVNEQEEVIKAINLEKESKRRNAFEQMRESIANQVGADFPQGLISVSQIKDWAQNEISDQVKQLPNDKIVDQSANLSIIDSTIVLNEFGERELYYQLRSKDGSQGWIEASKVNPPAYPYYSETKIPPEISCEEYFENLNKDNVNGVLDGMKRDEQKVGMCQREPKKECSDKLKKDCEDYAPATGTKRSKYDPIILKVAKESGIHPAILKAQIHSESSFEPNKENITEKQAYKKYLKTKGKHPGYQLWGKGLGQFGADNSFQYGLAWYKNLQEVKDLHPELKKLGPKEFEKERLKRKLYIVGDRVRIQGLGYRTLKNIFDPEASIRAIAHLYKNNLKAPINIPVEDNKRNCLIRETDNSCRVVNIKEMMDEEEKLRFAVMSYIRGHGRLTKSSANYTRYNGPLPCHLAFAVRTSPMVEHEVGICATNKIIGICENDKSLFEIYKEDYPKWK